MKSTFGSFKALAFFVLSGTIISSSIFVFWLLTSSFVVSNNKPVGVIDFRGSGDGGSDHISITLPDSEYGGNAYDPKGSDSKGCDPRNPHETPPPPPPWPKGKVPSGKLPSGKLPSGKCPSGKSPERCDGPERNPCPVIFPPLREKKPPLND